MIVVECSQMSTPLPTKMRQRRRIPVVIFGLGMRRSLSGPKRAGRGRRRHVRVVHRLRRQTLGRVSPRPTATGNRRRRPEARHVQVVPRVGGHESLQLHRKQLGGGDGGGGVGGDLVRCEFVRFDGGRFTRRRGEGSGQMQRLPLSRR